MAINNTHTLRGIRSLVGICSVQRIWGPPPPNNTQSLISYDIKRITQQLLSPFTESVKRNGKSIVQLPSLPPCLQSLDCRQNQLTDLPELPYNLRKISFNYNPIEAATLEDMANELEDGGVRVIHHLQLNIHWLYYIWM